MTMSQPPREQTGLMAPDPTVIGWLASAHPSPIQAQREWSSIASVALIPLGERFDAVRIPETLVHAVTGSDTHSVVDSRLAEYLNGGPVIRDPHSHRYYALVPPGAMSEWQSPAAACLGQGTYLGVPHTDRTSPDQTWGTYWSVPMARAGTLCSEADVLRLVIAGQRLTDEATQDLPVDVTTMRTLVARLLDANTEPPSDDELRTLTLQLRGHLMLLIPEVEDRTRGRAADDAVRVRALAGVGEARRRLDQLPGRNLIGEIKHAQALARSVRALCNHLENLQVNPRH